MKLTRWTWVSFVFVILALRPGAAHAAGCSASASSIDFGQLSPIALREVDTTGSITVTCTWPALAVMPNALVCLNLGGPDPRVLRNGGNTLQYTLYQDASRLTAWGSVAAGTQPIALVLTKPPAGVSASQSVTIYGRIAGNQPAVPTVNNSNTTYKEMFNGTSTALSYGFYRFIEPTCAGLAATDRFPFDVSAIVVNDCNITATGVGFGAVSVTTAHLRSTGTITARCTNGDAWRIALSAGAGGNVSARRMQRSGGGGEVAYQLYLDSSHATVWGDGAKGTSTGTGTGSGYATVLTVYGDVPAQTTPAPGNYSDTITATISF
ncbi:spore coat U domain-containing protein [Trinickia diaoshuihuensis]|uniref:Csu type fimbrial protein n=1 Tax=Trinickia diaoshuihuensis TaxID=2292265 RepID=UPI000E230313|nr:spore coat protein U domain-containing protein [Trinickia diaoshuihuensis]